MSLLKMEHISKQFSGVTVLHDVMLDLKPGKVHALMGENGAGKSTLMKILSGIYRPDGGQILLDGKPVHIGSPSDAIALGIGMIQQELSPVPELPVAQNIYLGREPKKGLFVDYRTMNRMAQQELKQMDITHISPQTKIGRLKVADQQMVEIAKALSLDARIIVMDEPTSAITDREVEALFGLIRTMRDAGKAIVYISHKMDEVFEISDEITILRDGQYIGTWDIDKITRNDVIKNMVGREVTDIFPKQEVPITEEMLRVENLSKAGKFQDVSFDVKRGEILGIAGLVGAGRSEVMQAIFGYRPADSGKIFFQGKEVKIANPTDAMKLGIAFVTEDRKEEGLFLDESIAHNITLADLENFLKFGFLDKKKERQAVREQRESLRIKCTSERQRVRSLSGGNQQKVVLAKWLLRKPTLLIMDEPTRGIDVGAKAEIYKLMGEFVSRGNSIIMISSEMPEAMGLSDRIVVFSNGHTVGELNREEFNQEAIMLYAVERL